MADGGDIQRIEPRGKLDVLLKTSGNNVFSAGRFAEDAREIRSRSSKQIQGNWNAIAFGGKSRLPIHRIEHGPNAQQIFHRDLSIGSGTQKRNRKARFDCNSTSGRRIHQRSDVQTSGILRCENRLAAVGCAHEERLLRMRLPKSAWTISQIKTRRWKTILFPAKEPGMIEALGGIHRRGFVRKDADFADACRQCRGHGRRRPQDIENDDSAIANLGFVQICGSKDDINWQRRGHMPA